MNLYCAIIIFFRLFYLGVALDFDGSLNIKIEHSLNCEEQNYCPRGNINLKSIRAGTSVIEQIDFNGKHIEQLKRLAETDGFYTIKTIVTSAENKEAEFLSSVKAETFLENGLSDVINAWILPNGVVIAVNFQVANNTDESEGIRSKKELEVKSNFFLRHVEQAPVPDTATYIQKIEREREAREKGELKDNRSFLAKYWMYIVPVAIFIMISGAANPEAAGQTSR